MNAFTDNFEKMTQFGSEGFEPFRQIAGVAVDSMEKLTRANYALCGDMLDFAVAQARLPLNVSEPKELLERQVESGKAFAQLVSERLSDYVELGQDLQQNVAQFADAAEPVKKATAKKTGARKAA